jgi:glycosyltransferase involved in cell wall biosynthesis
MKILYVYADDTYFWRNRLGLACEARDQGFDAVLMAPVSDYRSKIEEEGIRVIPWKLSRRSINPFREILSFVQVLRVYQQERPDIVQHETLKAIIHGGMAARLTGHKPSVNVICGLGAIFIRSDWKTKVIRRLLLRVLSFIFRSPNSQVAFQNDRDRELLVSANVVTRGQSHVTPGNGVRVERFTPQPEPEGIPIVLLPGRMLWEKGVGDFVEAAKILRKRDVSARFVLVGAPDPDNPGCIPEEQLLCWERSGIVEWWRHRADMPVVYAQATVVCLPSYYGEGLPNVLAEAGASGRAVVTTSIPGCLQAVTDGENGLVVPVREPISLAGAIQRLLEDQDLRRRLGAVGRHKAVQEFSHARIVMQILSIYRGLLNEKWPEPTSSGESSNANAGVFFQA